MSGIGKSIGLKVYQWLPGTEGRGDWGVSANGYKVAFRGQTVVKLIVMMVTQLCECTKNPTELYTLNGEL